MTWFKVDDGFAFHPKALAAGNLALGLWVRAGAYSSAHLTEGFIRKDIVASLGTLPAAKKLVEAGLWDEVEGGFCFHQWDERNPSRDDVEADRSAARARMKVARDRKRSPEPAPADPDRVRDSFADCSGEQTPNVRANFGRSSGNPDPTRPDPLKAVGLERVEREVEVDLDLPLPADQVAALRLSLAPWADPSEMTA